MAIALSTAGITVNYAVETSAGVRPSTFTQIKGIKSVSDLNPEPNNLDCTPLEETEFKQYIPGLRDVGGVVTFTANNTSAFQTAWATLVSAAQAGASTSLATWFKIEVPELDKGFYFAGTPTELGLSAIEVDSILEISAYVTPNKVEGWA